MQTYTVAFFGHRNIKNFIEIEKILEKYFRTLLSEKEYVEFLVGRNGDFDQCVSSIIKKVKKEYRDDNSRLVLILPYATSEYLNNRENFEKYYDYIEISQKASESHPKAAIKIRNREMVDRADFIVSFVNERKGGAYEALLYARNNHKENINLNNLIKNL